MVLSTSKQGAVVNVSWSGYLFDLCVCKFVPSASPSLSLLVLNVRLLLKTPTRVHFIFTLPDKKTMINDVLAAR